MVVRFYSSVAPETTLSAGITSGTTTIQLGSVTGFPTNTPFTLALDYEGATEELVQVSAVALTTCTVTRGIDGTSAAAHNAGARVRHVSSARDFADSRNHENSSNGVHGLAPGEDLVGTMKVQTLSNKTFIDATGSFSNITVENVGNNALKVVGDPANPTDPAITSQPDILSPVTFAVLNNGQIRTINPVSVDVLNNNYKIRVAKSTGTDIFAVFSGGSVNSTLSNGADGYGLTASADNVTRMGFYINSALSALRAAIYTNGTMDLNCSSAGSAILDIQMAAGQTGSPLRILDSASSTVASITAGGTVSAPNANFGTLTVTGTTNFTPTTATTGIATASSGWSLTSTQAVKVAGTTTVNLAFTRTGADIVGETPTDTNPGNIPDTAMCTLSATYRPNAIYSTDRMTFPFSTGSVGGTAGLDQSTGIVSLLTLNTSGQLRSTQVVRITMTYPS